MAYLTKYLKCGRIKAYRLPKFKYEDYGKEMILISAFTNLNGGEWGKIEIGTKEKPIPLLVPWIEIVGDKETFPRLYFYGNTVNFMRSSGHMHCYVGGVQWPEKDRDSWESENPGMLYVATRIDINEEDGGDKVNFEAVPVEEILVINPITLRVAQRMIRDCYIKEAMERTSSALKELFEKLEQLDSWEIIDD